MDIGLVGILLEDIVVDEIVVGDIGKFRNGIRSGRNWYRSDV